MSLTHSCNRLWNTLTRLRELLDAHFFAFLTTAVCLHVLWFVDQVSHIVFFLPSPRIIMQDMSLLKLVVGFWLFLLTIIVVYFYAVLLVVPRDSADAISRSFDVWRSAVRGGEGRRKWKRNWVAWPMFVVFAIGLATALSAPWLVDDLDEQLMTANLGWMVCLGVPWFFLLTRLLIDTKFLERLMDWPNYFLRLSARREMIAGSVALGFGAALCLSGLPSYWHAASALAIWLTVFGIWLIGMRFVSPPAADEDTVRRPIGRGLGFLLFSGVIGELTWHFPKWWPEVVSYRNYSIWAIFNILFMAVLVGRVLDYWQYKTKLPIRFVSVILLIGVGLMFSQTPQVGKLDLDADQTRADIVTWLKSLEQRIDAGTPDRPALVIAASGGGSRAALFTSLVYETLANEPLDAAGRTWDKQVILISSVSGGSLASAYFAAMERPTPALRDWRHSMTGEIKVWMTKKADEFATRFEESADDNQTSKILKSYQREHIQKIAKFCRQIEAGVRDPEPRWLLTSAFADDMCTDFMAPLLRGVMLMHMERGVSSTMFWQDQFAPHFSATNQDEWNSAKPLLLLNTTHVQSGRRVVVGYPNVPRGFLGLAMNADVRDDAMARGAPPKPWEAIPMSLADFDSRYSMTLAEGVRLSANFPYGFNPGAIQFRTSLRRPEPTRTIIDGGVLDNTGMDTLAHLFIALDRAANRSPNVPFDVRKQAERVMKKLRQRGVALLEVDSGAKPGRPNFLHRRFPNIFQPPEGISKAGYANALLLKHRYQDEISDALNPLRDDPDAPASALRVPRCRYVWFQCNHSQDVMTAWSLGPSDKAAILVQFLVELEMKKNLYFDSFRSLTENIQKYEQIRQMKNEQIQQKEEALLMSQLREEKRIQSAHALLSAGAKEIYDNQQPRTEQMIKLIMSHNPAQKTPARWTSNIKPVSFNAVQESLDHLKAHQQKLQAPQTRDAIRR